MKTIIRTKKILPPPTTDTRETVACAVCGVTTRERKPYCSDHVERMPYVVAILQAPRDYEADIRAVMAHRACESVSVISNDIVLPLEQTLKMIQRMPEFKTHREDRVWKAVWA